MHKKAANILTGGIFTHLVNTLVETDEKIWEKSDFGGAIDCQRCRPYMVFGKRDTRIWRSVTFDGEHHRINLELYCGDVRLRKAKIYAHDIIKTLHGADFPLKGHALIEIQHEQAEYIKLADRNEYLVRLLFTVLTVAD